MTMLRHLSTALAIALLLAGSAATAASAASTPSPQGGSRTLHLSADRIAFYYDRFLVEADGHVRITTGDGLTVTGSTMTMDLKNNRFMVAGGVHLDSPTGKQDGAALADFMDFNRVYFVPITSEPDRWTFVDGDYTHPVKGREMPGDTFNFPDLSANLPYLLARGAVIGENRYARFEGVTLMTGTAKTLPLPTYYINYSADPKLAQNSLNGAVYDATLQFAGNANSISALHTRYDVINHLYESFEQHFASKNAYAVLSVNPLTRPLKQYNIVTDYQPTDTFEVHSFTQFNALQRGFTTPDQEQHVTNIRATAGFRSFSASLTYQTVNYCLLGTKDQRNAAGVITVNQACGRNASLIGQPLSLSHPQTWSLDFSTLDFPKHSALPFKMRLRGGIGFIHDACTAFDSTTASCAGLQILNGAHYPTIANKYVGASGSLSSIRIGNPDRPFVLNVVLDGQRQWYSVPHNVTTIDGLASISRVYGSKVAAYASYEVRQISDRYNKASDASQLYPVNPIYVNPNFSSFSAFQGSATFRTLALGIDYTPTNNFAFNILARKHTDFPIAVPGLFATPATNVIGQSISGYFLGQPPYDVSGELRVRVLRHYYLDIARTYYFNFGTLKWSPTFVIQVTQ